PRARADRLHDPPRIHAGPRARPVRRGVLRVLAALGGCRPPGIRRELSQKGETGRRDRTGRALPSWAGRHRVGRPAPPTGVSMRAAIFVENDQPLVVEDVTPNPPGARDVVVRITASGVCHSDLSVINGTLPMPPPAILGHEGAGVVDWVGSEVRGL